MAVNKYRGHFWKNFVWQTEAIEPDLEEGDVFKLTVPLEWHKDIINEMEHISTTDMVTEKVTEKVTEER